MKNLLVVKDLNKSFVEDVKTLDNINLSVKKNEFVSIMGPSGSGKSTLLYCISAADSIDSGEVQFDGTNIHTLGEEDLSKLRRSAFAFVFQNASLLKNLTVLENILLPSLQEKAQQQKSLFEKAESLLSKTGILHLKDRSVLTLSGGEMQRVGICRALMNDAKILFADEPTGALNSKNSEEIMNIFSQIHDEGITIVLVTHDAKVAARASRVIFLKDGKIEREANLGIYNKESEEKNMNQIQEIMKSLEI